jgi:hypothetical protein
MQAVTPLLLASRAAAAHKRRGKRRAVAVRARATAAQRERLRRQQPLVASRRSTASLPACASDAAVDPVATACHAHEGLTVGPLG